MTDVTGDTRARLSHLPRTTTAVPWHCRRGPTTFLNALKEGRSMLFDELTWPEDLGVAIRTDPQAKRRPECPCGACCKEVRGATMGWHLRKGPAPVLDAYWRQRIAVEESIPIEDVNRSHAYGRDMSVWDFLEYGDHGRSRELIIPEWVDHKYRLRLSEGRWCYMAEPYNLTPAAFADFAALDEAGFDINVSAWRARHLAGHSLAIEIIERDPAIPQALYRFWDAAGRLLYVGLTMNPGARWNSHSKTKPWWTDVAEMKAVWYPDRPAVKRAEREAIKAEHPLHNIVHNRGANKPQRASVLVGQRVATVSGPACRGCGGGWFEPDERSRLACCDCDETFMPTT